MNKFLHGVARAITESFALPEPIMEIGAYQVEGQENLINLRSLFPGREYVGVARRCPWPSTSWITSGSGV